MGDDVQNNIITSLNAPAEYIDDNVLAYNQAIGVYGAQMQALFSEHAA